MGNETIEDQDATRLWVNTSALLAWLLLFSLNFRW